MTYGEKARELKDTLNCGQSVVVALDELTGLDESTAKALSTGLAVDCAAARPAARIAARCWR